MAVVTFCPHCRGVDIRFRQVNAKGEGVDLLPGVGDWRSVGKFDLYVCADCGHTQFFAQSDRLDQIREKWEKVETRLERHE